MPTWQVVLLGLIEGLTEFLPVSSTGHLLLVGWLIGVEDRFVDVFVVPIQFGAILAVLSLYLGRVWGVVSNLGRVPLDNPLLPIFSYSLAR